jgi:hypothetical protein
MKLASHWHIMLHSIYDNMDVAYLFFILSWMKKISNKSFEFSNNYFVIKERSIMASDFQYGQL